MEAFISPALVALGILAAWDAARRLANRTDVDLEQNDEIAELQERCDANSQGLAEVRTIAEQARASAVPAAEVLRSIEAKLDAEIANRKSNDALRLAAGRTPKGK